MVNERGRGERDINKDGSFNSFFFPQEEQAARQQVHLPRGCSPFRERVTVDERGVAFVKKLR